jgi:hypothetical protein
MAWFGAAAAIALIAVIFVDSFEAMVLPRRIRHGYRLAPLFYRSGWMLWRVIARRLPPRRWRNAFLSIFGPLWLFGLMSLWAVGLITGFALFHWSMGTPLALPRDTEAGFGIYLYFSGTTFFTLGFGDVVPITPLARVLGVTEAGLGFGFLAVVISYLPVFYQAFSRREITISLLDARAGSPPSGGELLRRLGEGRSLAAVGALLVEWERWSAELLESHLSFPVLGYYRSQHDNQSWVGTLNTILDTSSLLIAAVDSAESYQARLTFAMARHAAVDLGLMYQTQARAPATDRLPAADCARLRKTLQEAGLSLREEQAVPRALTELRGLYEPFVNALAEHFLFELPPVFPTKPPVDNWQTSAWMKRAPGLGGLPTAAASDEHFE